MFRIEFFVDDKKLAETLRTLDGRALNLSVVPVREETAEKKGGVVVAKNGSNLDLFATMLAKSKAERITIPEVKVAMTHLGLVPGGSSTFIKNAIKKGVLLPRAKSDKRGTGYRVAR